MKTLSKLLEEKMIQSNPDKLDIDWINNDKPVITKSGYEVKIYSVDYKEIPNQLHGKVFFSEGPVDGWVWDETGKCITCKDRFGNGYRPGDDEMLLKNND